jgi:2-polyprenyl-6-methoxyphenol hydroxylase-like FAD-dependent oxidoreductase
MDLHWLIYPRQDVVSQSGSNWQSMTRIHCTTTVDLFIINHRPNTFERYRATVRSDGRRDQDGSQAPKDPDGILHPDSCNAGLGSCKLTPRQVGGSLGGLMTSIALRRQGHNVRIFERSPTPLLQDQGAGIVAGGDVQEFLRAFDRSSTPSAVPSRLRLYLDKDGRITKREQKTQQMTSWDLLYHICRANFDGLKTDYVSGEVARGKGEGEGVYEYGRQVQSIESHGDGVKVSYVSTLKGDDHDAVKHMNVDLVVVADGPSSEMRRKLCPASPKRTYAGYVAFRGTVPETELSLGAREVFVEKFPFFHASGTQILAYAIPGHNGTVQAGQRLVNWVWYCNADADSDAYRSIFTDRNGELHRYTLPPGNKMAPAVWERQRKRASEQLAPQFAELVNKTTAPFVQAITDLEPPADGKVWLLEGKALLVGDAVAGFRPHTAASTSQAAFHALRLPAVLAGTRSRKDYEEEVVEFATAYQKQGVMLGNRSQFGHPPHSS